MKKYLAVFVACASLMAIFPTFVSAALVESDFENVTFSNNRGRTTEKAGNHVIYNLGKGWNLVPLKFLMEASGRYNSYYKEGQTCDQDVFQNIWYYSPVRADYYQLPTINDWGSPKTRGNDVLLKEFQQKYYHIYAGSAWAYTPESCSIEGDSGTQLLYGNYSNDQQEIGYSHKELILKAGWNFVPINMKMVGYEKSLVELLSPCGLEKAYTYDQLNNKWIDSTAAAKNQSGSSTLFVSDLFETILVKTSVDCNFADFEDSSLSSPPALPN